MSGTRPDRRRRSGSRRDIIVLGARAVERRPSAHSVERGPTRSAGWCGGRRTARLGRRNRLPRPRGAVRPSVLGWSLMIASGAMLVIAGAALLADAGPVGLVACAGLGLAACILVVAEIVSAASTRDRSGH